MVCDLSRAAAGGAEVDSLMHLRVLQKGRLLASPHCLKEMAVERRPVDMYLDEAQFTGR